MSRDWSVAQEFLRECRESSMHSENSFWPSKGKSSTVVCTSLGKPESWSHDACLMTTAVAMDRVTVSAEANKACRFTD